MQKVKIPVRLNFGRSATKQLGFDGYIPLSELPRLAAFDAGDVMVEVVIACDRDEQRAVRLKTIIRTQLQLSCQRCNEPYIHNVDLEVVYSPVKDDRSADNLPAEYEAVLLSDEDDVNLHQLIEDEILLSLPYVPMHELADCNQSADSSWGEIDAQEEKPNPFAVLANLKK